VHVLRRVTQSRGVEQYEGHAGRTLPPHLGQPLHVDGYRLQSIFVWQYEQSWRADVFASDATLWSDAPKSESREDTDTRLP
jgi:hypothetical protein